MRSLPRRKAANTIQARMVPLIDVVFLLLIFFILTVNFSQQEGFMSVELPGSANGQLSEVEPMLVYVATLDNGDCQIAMGGQAVVIPSGGDFSGFVRTAGEVLSSRNRSTDDPILLFDSPGTSWQHMMNVYDALLASKFANIIISDN